MAEIKTIKEITSSLVNHKYDLERIYNIYLKIKEKYENEVKNNYITPHKVKLYIFILENALGLVGDWSQQIFDILKPLEDFYMSQHSSSPRLGRKLFIEKYENLHKPYDQIKNRLWKLLLEIKGVDENAKDETEELEKSSD